MYFLIELTPTNELVKKTFLNTIKWRTIVDQVEGTIIELFKNNKLTEKAFDEYFETVKLKKEKYGPKKKN